MHRTRLPVALLVAALAAAAASCSRLPNAPSADASLGRGASPSVIGRVDDPPPPVVGGGGGVINSIDLPAGVGGTVTAGRFTLVIDKNSLKMPAKITIIQPDIRDMRVEFEITPPEANDFQVPVQLVADCSQDPLDQVVQETTYWWGADGWKEAPASSVFHNELTITTHAHQLAKARIALWSPGKGIQLPN